LEVILIASSTNNATLDASQRPQHNCVLVPSITAQEAETSNWANLK
jgi:hypothetical protein